MRCFIKRRWLSCKSTLASTKLGLVYLQNKFITHQRTRLEDQSAAVTEQLTLVAKQRNLLTEQADALRQ
jgi:hypothetical protein